ncbi:aldo/keto reductase [Leptolyngbya ohadii]|uniref:aldo/keto reductase n=1 Tax=Leptolyngbya ohadii TaxID=1962290 RepID=UPI000B59CB42|nr:aldo/keto reductase [Leptolyngbya ohadii]
MKYNSLGESDLRVSEICLGTMTFGRQNTIEEAHQQLDYAIAQGVNFIDTAEMYPVPAQAETYGFTESYVGEWLRHQQRDRFIIATKIAGPGRGMKWIRDGAKAINRANIRQAVDASLSRLQTDYIDLYQIHWSDRYVPLFGQTQFDPAKDRETETIAEQLIGFAEMIQAGKIRYLGLSNETPWGITKFCQVAEQLGLPKIVSVQNAYNLLNRVFDWTWAEACYREKVSLLAYSPLAFGCLTGKYLHHPPEQARLLQFPGFGQRYLKPNVPDAVAAYVEIAKQHGMTPAQMAIAFVRSRWFVSSAIVGATSIDQLKENFSNLEVRLSEEVLAEIESVHLRYPNPAP